VDRRPVAAGRDGRLELGERVEIILLLERAATRREMLARRRNGLRCGRARLRRKLRRGGAQSQTDEPSPSGTKIEVSLHKNLVNKKRKSRV
jgi:hypothetical protein